MNSLHYSIPLLITHLYSGSTGGSFEFPNIGHKVMIPQFPSGRVTAAEGVPRRACKAGAAAGRTRPKGENVATIFTQAQSNYAQMFSTKAQEKLAIVPRPASNHGS